MLYGALNVFFAYEPVWSIGTGIIPKINELDKQVEEIKRLVQNGQKVSSAREELRASFFFRLSATILSL